MATDGKGYAISVAIYLAVLIVVFVLFSVWRRLSYTRKFFAPKRYVTEEGYSAPPKLPESFLGWIPSVVKATEAQIIASAGIDAALYMKFLRMSWEIFVFASLVACIVILPINLTNDTVDNLMNVQSAPPSPVSVYTYWVPPPPPPVPEGETPKDTKNDVVEPPQFYNDSATPTAPPGLEWHQYAEGVPALPPAPPNFVWYYSADNVPSDYQFSDLDKTTLSNVPQRSTKMIAHAIFTWVVTFFVFFQLWRYCKEALRLRMFYLLNSPRGAESHSVLCTDIPAVAYGTIPNRLDGTLLKVVPAAIKDKAFAEVNAINAPTPESLVKVVADADAIAAAEGLSTLATDVDEATGRWEVPNRWQNGIDGTQSQGSVKGMVDKEFKDVYQSDFSHSHMAYDTSGLDSLVGEYEKTSMAAQDLVDDYISKKRRDVTLEPKMITVIGAKMGAWGRDKYGLKPAKVDAFEFYQERLTYLKEQIAVAQVDAKQKVWPSSFVTFNRRTAQVVASGALMCEDLSTWRVQPAPRPTEIVWKNLGLRMWERSARNIIMWCAFIALTTFFMIPVAAIQALVSTTASVSFIENIAFLNALVTAILPGLVLTIFIALLPPIIKAMNRFTGMVSLTEIDLGLMTRFFIFQVVTVFFGSFLAGSVANQFKQLINDPGSIVTLLGTAVPQTAIFFMTYVTLQAMLTTPLNILRIVPFIIFWIKSKFLASTERAKARLWQNQMFSYGTVVPDDNIINLLGLTFCLICPIIAPAALIYFCTTYIVRKHDLLYVYRQPYQAGAMAWPRIFKQICTALFIFQLVMICLLALKKSVAGPIIIVPLPFLTFVFMGSVSSTFWRPMEALSLMAASELDKKESGVATSAIDAITGVDVDALYLSPSFTVSDAEHALLMDDCKRMKSVLEGGVDDKLFERQPSIEEFHDTDDAMVAAETVDAAPIATAV